MVKKKLPVRWSPKAKQRLDGIYDYIAKDSVSAARYVKKALTNWAELWATFLKNTPERNPWLMNQKTIGQYQNGDTNSFMR